MVVLSQRGRAPILSTREMLTAVLSVKMKLLAPVEDKDRIGGMR